jgi:GT2 family glycosyltransferase
MTLTLPECSLPELSVVMVTYGAWPLTERAIEALTRHTDRPFELIVVDNASEDQTRAQLSGLPNVRLILNDHNRGFGAAINQGAERARGEYLLLLNTDVFVHPGWLEPLLAALAEPSVGLCVPRYLHADGSLQEAGALLARDGTIHFYGDGEDPEKPCYRFRRRVDYGSAACMLIRRASFQAVGGLDDLFAPAYYEDSDLCLRFAQRGLGVTYEPRSTVTHVRHGSGSFDAAAELSERHRGLFIERWGAHLAGRPPTLVNATEQTVIGARDALAMPRVLICARTDDLAAERLVGAVLAGWRQARLTWATETQVDDRSESERWLALGVEMLDAEDPSWLSGRLFHYDLVVRGITASAGLLAAVEQSQPQAAQLAVDQVVHSPDSLLSRLVPVLARAGIAPVDGATLAV